MVDLFTLSRSPALACDYLPVIDVFFQQFYAFFIVVHVGATAAPTDDGVAQELREATPFGEEPTYLIRDNDSKYGARFAAIAAGANLKVLKTPIGAPNANAVCERFLGSVRRACLDHFLLMGPRSVTQELKEYLNYFNDLRPHQGLGQRIPDSSWSPMTGQMPWRISAVPVLGGLHHAYR